MRLHVIVQQYHSSWLEDRSMLGLFGQGYCGREKASHAE